MAAKDNLQPHQLSMFMTAGEQASAITPNGSIDIG